MIKAVIYDFDGTLIQTLKLSFDAYEVALLKLGVRASEEDIISKCFNKLDSEVASQFNVDLDLFTKYYGEEVIKGYKKAKLHLDVIFTLAELKKLNVLVGIGTLKEMEKIAEVLDRTEIRKYFDIIITNDSGLRKKPEIFLVVCEKLKVKPEEAVIVGDAENDLDAAKKIKAKSILFYPKAHEKYYNLETLKKLQPDFIIKNHKEIINKLSILRQVQDDNSVPGNDRK